VLAAVWRRLSLSGAPQPRPRLLGCLAAVAPMAGALDGREARRALCAALAALSTAGLTELVQPAALLAQLNAMSATEVTGSLKNQ
jgi:hypothetical protein